MPDLPKNAAGKPLRIKLATRLNLGKMADAIPFSQRHFEAPETPSKEASLSDPIRCYQVLADLGAVTNALRCAQGVDDVAVRARPDGTPEAFVSSSHPDINALSLKMELSGILPGYSLPEPLHVLPLPLKRLRDGSVDFDGMEKEIMEETAAAMSSRALVVRDIIAGLLSIEAGNITGDSDFFLLGGNSLLLGKLAYQIRKQTGASLQVSQIFTSSTVNGIAGLIDEEDGGNNSGEGASISEHVYSAATSVTLGENEPAYPYPEPGQGRSSSHPLVLLVQIIPFMFFYPLKAAVTWSVLLFVLAYLAPIIDQIYIYRMLSLLAAILAGRLASRIVAPITAILFKWLVIGRYKPGTYRMWSNYYLRYWIVNQSLRSAGRGIFSMHPALEILYFRLLGAKIGSNVTIMKSAKLAEFDLLTIGDDVRIDSNVVMRGFCVERDGYFRLDPIQLGRGSVINTYTQVIPGAVVDDGAVYGPHASTNEGPSAPEYAMFNRSYREDPNAFLKYFVAWPICMLVFIASCMFPYCVILGNDTN
jgi:acetyltransferase-like isoleucine patch superfamily enzyme